jgi:hypothetical protein
MDKKKHFKEKKNPKPLGIICNGKQILVMK